MKAEDEAAQTADIQDVEAWEIAKQMEASPGLLEKVLDHLNDFADQEREKA